MYVEFGLLFDDESDDRKDDQRAFYQDGHFTLSEYFHTSHPETITFKAIGIQLKILWKLSDIVWKDFRTNFTFQRTNVSLIGLGVLDCSFNYLFWVLYIG